MSHQGLGDPTFVHIHPLYYYLVAAVNFFVADLWLAMKTVVIASHLLLGVAVFWTVAIRFSPAVGLLAGLTAQWLPYNMFLAVYSQAFPALLAVALSVGLVILAHILVALTLLLIMATVLFIDAARRLQDGRSCLKLLLPWAAAVVLSLGMTGWYWIPAVLERSLINPHGGELGKWLAPQLAWDRNFIFPILTALSEGSTSLAILWMAPLPLAWVALPALTTANRRAAAVPWHTSRPTAIVMLVCLLSLFFASGLSWPVWALLPPLQQMQFPWRFLGLGGVAAELLVGSFAADPLQRRWALSTLILSVAVTLLLLGQTFHGGKRLTPSNTWLKGSFGQPEYLPIWASKAQPNGGARPVSPCAADGSLCTILVDGTHQKVFGIDLPSSATVLLPVHFHPGWTANLRGETLAIGPSAANGLIELALPEGKNTVTLSWGGTQLENGAQLVTLCSLVAMLGLSGYSAWRQRK